MKRQVQSFWKESLLFLRKRLWKIFAIHIAYLAFGVVLFAPMTGLLGKFLLNLSGQTVLSDLDIAYFFLTPTGMAALILFVSTLITILIFEQASIMAVCNAAVTGKEINFITALLFSLRRVKTIFFFAIQLVLRVLLITLPFLGLAFAIAWVMLSQFDINYYLATRPPVFTVATTSIIIVLVAMAIVLGRNLCSWSLSLPLILFNNETPTCSFTKSERLTIGDKQLFTLTLSSWLLTGVLLSTVAFGSVQLLGSILAPFFFNSITLLIPALGALALLWAFLNILITTFTSGTFAALLILFYNRKKITTCTKTLPEEEANNKHSISKRLFFIFLLSGIVIATLAGFWLLKGIPPDNNTMIIAHRGAAGKAPENTIIAMRHAIQDGADWLEVDVQESIDGEVIIIHDSDFMKLNGNKLKVWEGSLEEIKTIDVGSWFNEEFSAERVPTLTEILELAKGKCKVLIELKYYGHDHLLEQRVAEIVEQSDMVENVAIMSLKYEGIRRFRALRPHWTVGLLTSKAIGKISDLDVDFLAINLTTAKPAFIRRIHSTGKKVYVWTVNDQISMARMMSLGVDGLITDEPAMANEVHTQTTKLTLMERLILHTAVLLKAPIPQNIYRDHSP